MNARPLPTGSQAILAALVLAAGVAQSLRAAVPNPGGPQEAPIAIVGATLHTISGETIEGGTIVFEKGLITAIGRGVTVPAGARRIEAAGKHVYPGLIQSASRLGLVEIDAVRATRDYVETGAITPNVKSWVAVNPESEVIPVTRSNGVLLAAVTPQGTLLQGQSAMMMLDGWTWDDMILRAPIAIHLDWPSMSLPRGPQVRDTKEKLEEARAKRLIELENAFEDAKAYWRARRESGKAPSASFELDARWEAMVPLFEKQIPLVVAAGEIRQIQAAVAFAKRHGVRLVLFGGEDAPYVADLLRENDVAVIVDGTHRLPGRQNDPYDHPYTVPARLYEAGVRYCISAGGPHYVERNLPFQAATAVAYGLPHDEALRAITIYPARILGVADRVGSLETGKDATLIVTTGDVLEITSQVESAFLQGRAVDLTNRQTVLNEKYLEKYRRLGLLRE